MIFLPFSIHSSMLTQPSEHPHLGYHLKRFSTSFSSINSFNKSTSLTTQSFLIDKFATSVEPVSLGVIVHGQLWCSKHMMYPKGFKSDVKLFSLLSPSRICGHVSEVLDGSLIGALFKGIEALDPSHQCLEYWNHKELISSVSSSSTSDDVKLVRGSSSSLADDVETKVFGIDLTKKENDNKLVGAKGDSLEGMKLVPQGLLKKASVDDLITMQKLVGSDAESFGWRVEIAALIEEIQKSM